MQVVLAGPDPIADLAGEERAATRAALALVVVAAITVGVYLYTAVAFGHTARHLYNQIRDNIRQLKTNPNATPAPVTGFGRAALAMNFVELVSFGLQALFMIWLYRAATLARRAGLPARRAPVWAWLGFFVPIVGFWFPYQVAADATGVGDPTRPLAGSWWGWWISQTLAVIPILAVSLFSVPAVVGLALVLAVLPVMAALTGRALIAGTLTAHRRMLTGA